MEFSRQEYWSGLPFPSPGNLPDPALQVTIWVTREAQGRLSTEELMLWTVVFEKSLESPLDCKEIKPVNPKRNQPWIFIGRTDAKAEALILWPPDMKNCLIGKDPDAGKVWRQEEKRMAEDEMIGWHHRLIGTWVWANSGRWWNTGKPSMLQSKGSQRVGHYWATEQ